MFEHHGIAFSGTGLSDQVRGGRIFDAIFRRNLRDGPGNKVAIEHKECHDRRLQLV
jgi:hypothetical protein